MYFTWAGLQYYKDSQWIGAVTGSSTYYCSYKSLTAAILPVDLILLFASLQNENLSWTKYMTFVSLILESHCELNSFPQLETSRPKSGRSWTSWFTAFPDTGKCGLTYTKFHKISAHSEVMEVSWFYWDHRLEFLVSKELRSQIKNLYPSISHKFCFRVGFLRVAVRQRLSTN